MDLPVWEEEPVPTIPDRLAHEAATSRGLILNQDEDYPQYFTDLKAGGDVMDAAVRDLYFNISSERLKDDFIQKVGGIKDPDARVRYVLEVFNELQDKQEITPYTRILFEAIVANDIYEGLDPIHDRYQQARTLADFQAMTVASTEEEQRLLESNPLAAELGADASMGNLLANLARELLPGAQIADAALTREMMIMMGLEVNWVNRIFAGHNVRELRAYVHALPPAQRVDFTERVQEFVAGARDKQIPGIPLNTLKKLEAMMNVLDNTAVTHGIDPGVDFLTIVLDIASALDIFPAGKVLTETVAKLLGWKSISPIADAVSKANPRRGGDFFNALIENSRFREKLDIKPEELQLKTMPKPEGFSPAHVDPAPEFAARNAEQVTFSAGEAEQVARNIPRQLLTPEAKVAVVDKSIDDSININGRIHLGKSEVAILPDEQGFRFTARIGETPEHPFISLEDAGAYIRANFDGDVSNVRVSNIDLNTGKIEKVESGEGALKAWEQRSPIDPDAPRDIQSNQGYFVEVEQTHFWNPMDAQVFGGEGAVFRNPSWLGSWTRKLLPPNAKFTDKFYDRVITPFLQGQAINPSLREVVSDFTKLTGKEVERVVVAREWIEEFARTEGKPPTIGQVWSQFPDMTTRERKGMQALQDTFDTMYRIENERVFRDWNNAGFKTARSDVYPSYSGKVYTEDEAVKSLANGNHIYDPSTKKGISMMARDVRALYARGGRILKTELAIQPDAKKADRFKAVIADPQHGYKVGALTDIPLKYTPGYFPRFYEDLYFIVKLDDNATINGRVLDKSDVGTPQFIKGKKGYQQVIRTAPTHASGRAYAERLKPRPGTTYDVVRARDLDPKERNLANIDRLQMEGRMFFDERDAGLLNIDSNKARLRDPIESVIDSINLFSRQISMEDTVRALKQTWHSLYGKEFNIDRSFYQNTDYEDLIRGLRTQAGTKRSTQARNAIDMLNYIRFLEGVDRSFLASKVREGAADIAQRIGAFSGRKLGAKIEYIAQTVSPLRSMRTFTFHTFMSLRPARQAILQTMQASILAPLDPKYYGTGGFLRDLTAIRLMNRYGGVKFQGKDSAWAKSAQRKAQKLSTFGDELPILTDELSRRGLLQSVDIHSFSGGMAKEPSPGHYGMLRKAGKGVLDKSRQIGFDLGETNNLIMTYGVATRRYLKENNLTSLRQLSRDDWDRVNVKASNMALGMVRPNNFGYQHNMLGAATQFLSFTHKMFLTLMGQNPAFSKADLTKMWLGAATMWGVGGMFGVRDWVEQEFYGQGLISEDLDPETQQLIVDIISGGLVDWTMNKVLQNIFDNDRELAITEFLSPAGNIRAGRILGEWIFQSPVATFVGPSATPFSRFGTGVAFLWNIQGDFLDRDTPEQAEMIINHVIAGLIPVLSDVTKARTALHLDNILTGRGDITHLEPGMQEIYARALLGVTNRQELARYTAYRLTAGRKKEVKEDSKAIYNSAKQLFNTYIMSDKTEADTERLLSEAKILGFYVSSLPEEERAAFQLEFMSLMNSDDLDLSLDQVMSELIFTDDAALILDNRLIPAIRNMHTLPPATREEFVEHIRRQTADQAELGRILHEQLEKDIADLEGEVNAR